MGGRAHPWPRRCRHRLGPRSSLPSEAAGLGRSWVLLGNPRLRRRELEPLEGSNFVDWTRRMSSIPRREPYSYGLLRNVGPLRYGLHDLVFLARNARK